jgi:hypothetical protein
MVGAKDEIDLQGGKSGATFDPIMWVSLGGPRPIVPRIAEWPALPSDDHG